MSSNNTGSPSEELSRKSMDATYLRQLRTLKAFAKEVESVVDAYVTTPHATSSQIPRSPTYDNRGAVL